MEASCGAPGHLIGAASSFPAPRRADDATTAHCTPRCNAYREPAGRPHGSNHAAMQARVQGPCFIAATPQA